jgi:hypothetical protein
VTVDLEDEGVMPRESGQELSWWNIRPSILILFHKPPMSCSCTCKLMAHSLFIYGLTSFLTRAMHGWFYFLESLQKEKK